MLCYRELDWENELIQELQKELKVSELELEALGSTVSALQNGEGQERPIRARKRLQIAESPSKGPISCGTIARRAEWRSAEWRVITSKQDLFRSIGSSSERLLTLNLLGSGQHKSRGRKSSREEPEGREKHSEERHADGSDRFGDAAVGGGLVQASVETPREKEQEKQETFLSSPSSSSQEG